MKNFILFTFCLLSLPLFAQKNNTANWTIYQHPEEVNDIAETENDIWFATNIGVVQMNKNTFAKTYYNSTNSPLPSNHIQALATDADGQLFIGTYDNIMARFGGGDDWEIIDVPYYELFVASDEMAELYTIYIDDENTKWVGTNSGLLRYADEEWTIFNDETIENPSFSFRDVWDIAQTDNGDIFIASFEFYKYDGETFTNLSEFDNELFSYGGASVESHGDEVWFSNAFFLVANYKDDAWQNIYRTQDEETNLPSGFMIDLKIDNSGIPHVLYDTEATRIVKLEGEEWVAVNDGQTNAILSPTKRLFFSENGGRWLSKRSIISRQLGDEDVETELNQSPLEHSYASMLKQAPDGSVYCYSAWGFNQKLVKFNSPTNWEEIELPTVNAALYDIEFNSAGDIFISLGDCIYQYTNEDWTCISFPTSLPQKMAMTSQDELWVSAATYGLYHYDGENWEHFTYSPEGLSSSTVRNVVVDREDNIWLTLGTNNSLQRFDGENWELFNHFNSPLPEYLSNGEAFFDENNEMWFPVGALGVFHYDGQTWEVNSPENSGVLYVNTVNSNSQNTLYTTSTQGVFEYDGENWQPFLNLENSLLHHNQTSSFIIDDEGFFWISTIEGLAIYDSEIISAINNPEILVQNLLTISPNPTTNFISFKMQNADSQDFTIIIYDNAGGLLHSEKMNEGEQMNVSDLPIGVYYLKVTSEKGSKIGKFVKK